MPLFVIDKFSKYWYACKRKEGDKDCAKHRIIPQSQIDLTNRAGGRDRESPEVSQYEQFPLRVSVMPHVIPSTERRVLQNQISLFACLSVCLFVCLFVCIRVKRTLPGRRQTMITLDASKGNSL